MIVTTSLGMSVDLVAQAMELAERVGAPYVERRKSSLKELVTTYHRVLLVTQEGWSLEQAGGSRLSFHPDTAMLRIKAPRDPLVELVGAGARSVLDATMGLASDSIVLAAAGHRITALESELLPYLIVQHGLQTLDTGHPSLNQAMRSIQTLNTDSLTFLKLQAEKSIDVVYFDPMFSENIPESTNLNGLTPLANTSPVTAEMLHEAKRVAREKIILKAHFRDSRLEELGFHRLVRPNQKFHYGVIEVP